MSLRNEIYSAFRRWALSKGVIPDICFVLTPQMGVPIWVMEDKTTLVLNVSDEATKGFVIEDDVWRFASRFGGAVAELSIPAENIIWIKGRDTPFGIEMPMEMDEMEREFFKDDEQPPAPETPQVSRPKIVVVKK